MGARSAVFVVCAALILCTSHASRVYIVQGGNAEYGENAASSFWQEPNGDVATAEAWSEQGQSAESWNSLFTPVLNPFAWFMQQMQQMEAELAAATGQLQPRAAQQEALLRHVGCQRLKNGALRDYQAASHLVGDMMGKEMDEEQQEERAAEEYTIDDAQVALNLMSLMDDRYNDVYSDNAEEQVQEQEQASEGEDVRSTAAQDTTEDHAERMQMLGQMLGAAEDADMREAGADVARDRTTSTSMEVVVGSVRSDGQVHTTRYTVDDQGGVSVSTNTYQQQDEEQAVQQQQEEGDNLDQAASVADLMMDQVRSAYLRGQLANAQRARAFQDAVNAAGSSASSAQQGARTTYYVSEEDSDEAYGSSVNGGAAVGSRDIVFAGPLAALAQLLDGLLLGGVSASYSPVEAEMAERAKVVAAVQEQMQREAMLDALMAARATAYGASSQPDAEVAEEVVEEPAVLLREEQDTYPYTTMDDLFANSEAIPPASPSSFTDIDWSLVDTATGSINWGVIVLLFLLSATVVVFVGFIHSWFALRAAMHAAPAEVLVPVVFEHEGRLTQGYMVLPRGMAATMADEAEQGAAGPWGNDKGCCAEKEEQQQELSIDEQKAAAHKVWGAKQAALEEAQEAEQQQQPADAEQGGVVIASEHVDGKQ
mmetsp:Transcript_3022/g.7511  ORF Transcript_3022/g.7511 Transcript_3022/m.7511 type:complete len:653 (-) Transcript_3022:755-2713(-)|eukprot:CAMPEP_0202866340 /NCGR_PEP_ID=MMETSP1391-20130828/7330_1 /ASSEMBLY_ACC=CAM_ASM_000867 /TAXON_ID=1034604 /ORGANISM="Chlamydomonas leiostraca, Strain SAG 11-49" /LENGTH=652 /DNA_ID=CAMNT_0049546273 /DNA_START=55 /DNA_END=2013 /DNA_ORIENTATION=-